MDHKMASNRFQYLKVFGERNTGTNFLCKLIRDNTDIQVLSHHDNSVPAARLSHLESSHFCGTTQQHFESSLRKLILERLIDQQREDEYAENFGWKHARVSVDDLQKPERFSSTFFVFLIRNPWRFVSALHRKPYNLFPEPKGDLSDFVDSSFLANERDRMPSNYIANPVELWNCKVESYFDCSSRIENSMVCYYEEIVAHPKAFMNALSCACNVSPLIRIPAKSTKTDYKTYDDYREEALSYDPRRSLGENLYFRILEKLDKKVLDKTIYA